MAEPITVLIADDQPSARRGLRALLATWPSAILVGEARDGGEAVHLALETRPDLALLDARMPGMDGIEATGLIKAASPATRIIVLSIYTTCEEQAIAAGADLFLSKADAPQVLLPLMACLIATRGSASRPVG